MKCLDIAKLSLTETLSATKKNFFFFFKVVEMRVVYFKTSYVNITEGGKANRLF